VPICRWRDWQKHDQADCYHDIGRASAVLPAFKSGTSVDNGDAMSDADTKQLEAGLTILVNGEPHLEYDRDKPLPEQQRVYLDRMDARMDGGIELGGAQVDSPNTLQRAQFVAIQVIEGLQEGNEPVVAASCAYLASRMPDLTQVKAQLVDEGYSVELVFGEPYVKEVAVQFSPRLS